MRLIDWFFAARPLLHLPAWSIFLVAWHDHQHLSGKSFGFIECNLLIILSLTAAAALYLNQLFDLESDRVNQKLGFFDQHPKAQSSAPWLFMILNLLALGIALSISTRTAMIVIQWIVLGYLYSASPFRLKDRPWLGLLANAAGVGWLTSLLVMPEINFHNAGLLGWDNPQFFFFAVAGVTTLTTIPDLKGDEQTGKRTVAVVYGAKSSCLVAGVLFLGAIYSSLHSAFIWQQLIATISFVFAFTAYFVASDSFYRLAAKLPILLLTLLAGWYYPYYLLFIIALVFITRLYYRQRYGQTYPELA